MTAVIVCPVKDIECHSIMCGPGRCAYYVRSDQQPEKAAPGCDNCGFGLPCGSPHGDLECRRHPPTVGRVWPMVRCTDWCGEFKERP